MARKTKKQKEQEKRLKIFTAIAAAFLIFSYLLADAVGRTTGNPIVPPVEELLGLLEPQSKPVSVPDTDGSVSVTAIDVGQGDSTLIRCGETAILIDAGENNQGGVVLDALKAHGVTRLDYVIGTHPHSDHIGGLDMVIDALPVGEVILPSVPENQTPTTKTYRDLLESIDRAGCALSLSQPGRVISLNGGGTLTLLGPPEGKTYDDLNNYSVVTRLDWGARSFLFGGDCSAEEEADLLSARANLDADVLFVAHHGSRSSSTKAYLDAVSPLAARISCGTGNDYGHPHSEIVKRVTAICPLYRTDLLGEITFSTDGTSLTVQWADGGETIV